MRIFTLTRGDIPASNSYVVISGDSFSVIDPSVGYFDALRSVPEISEKKLRYVILTHAHIDHFWEIVSYVKNGGAVLISHSDADKLADPHMNCSDFITGPLQVYSGEYSTLREGDKIDLGEDTLDVIEVPGHTCGSICLIGDGVIFSGDTLFAGGAYGRYDLPTGNMRELIESIKRILSYPSEYEMYSGHGSMARLADIKKYFSLFI